jgi:hypothetical protein
MTVPEPHPRRRAYEQDVDPAVIAFIERADGDVRHLLRNEFTVALNDILVKLADLAGRVTAGQIQATGEHAEVNGRLEALHGIVSVLPDHERRISQLERHDDIDTARSSARDELLARLDKNRRWMVTTAIALAAVVVGCAALVAAHIH